MTKRHIVLALFLLPAVVIAGSNSKKAVAIRTTVAPRIDGLLDEPEWQLGHPETEFKQRDPVEGASASMPTEIRILYDDEALYFGCTMFDPDPSKIVARLARRDDEVESDVISIRIDSYHDHQTAFEFTVNAAGVKTDILQYNDGRDEDVSWDAVWDVETQITSKGWIAEIKIPFKVLRFAQQESYEWGVQMIRRISRLQEQQQWVLIRKSESGSVSKFGHLVGLENIPSPSNIQIIPYTMGSSRFVPKSNSYPDGRELTSNAGFDFKYRPGSGLTIDATINPDFGQVEADPAVLNLTTFETFYPEKRQFFIEGSQILRFTTFGGEFGPGLFYSRRIGKALNVETDEGYILNAPRFATILGAAKISGKTSSGLSIGVLEAVTRKETATLVHWSGLREDITVEPLTNYSLLRLRQDVFQNSNVGMAVTSVNKEGKYPGMTAGVDWNLKFLESTYRVDGFLAGSRTVNSLSPRGDGTAGKFNFSKDGGEHWRGFASFDFTSKKYNINDIGFFRRPNDYGWLAQILYRDDEVTSVKRIWNISSLYHLRRNFDGAELIHSINLEGYIMLPSYWELGVQGEIDRGRYDDRETRGYGLYPKPGTQRLEFSVESDPRQPVVGEMNVNLGSDRLNGRFRTIEAAVELRPASNITLEFETGYQHRANERAWIGNPTEDAAEGWGSLFAERTTKEWDITSRGSYVFTRDLTLQWYFQIFFAKGKYSNFQFLNGRGEFWPTASSSDFDFNRLSFNSNLVLRWEYLPGSTAYLVWSQARHGEHSIYETTFGNDFSDTFSLPSENVVLLKVSYWLSL